MGIHYRRRATYFAATLGLLLLASGHPAPARAQQFTPQQAAAISSASLEQIDAEWGPSQKAQFEQTHHVYHDPRVDRITERLLNGCPRRDIEVQVVDDPVVNAQTLIGGSIYVNTGLLDTFGADDDAVAFVIAHEIGHALRRHPAEKCRLEAQTQPSQQPRTAGEALGQLLGHALGHSSHVRDTERQADNDGVRLILASGFNREGVFRGFEILDRQPKDGRMKWFLDHPQPKDRIKRLHDFVDKLTGAPKPQKSKNHVAGKPRSGKETTKLSVSPGELRVKPGESAQVTYHFAYPKEQVTLLSRSAYFVAPDGSHLSELIGPYDTRSVLPSDGKYSFKDVPLLPVDVAEKAKSLKLTRVVLQQSFRGERQDGTPIEWSSTLRFRLK